MQGHAHGVRSSNVLTTAVTRLATSLAAALQPYGESSHENAAGSSTPPQHTPTSPAITPVRAAQLNITYIKQIKELHTLVEIGALTMEQYEKGFNPSVNELSQSQGLGCVYVSLSTATTGADPGEGSWGSADPPLQSVNNYVIALVYAHVYRYNLVDLTTL